MSNYWKKKLDELEKSKAQNTAKKTEKTDYWQNKMTELEKETERKKADIAPVKQTVKDEYETARNRIVEIDDELSRRSALEKEVTNKPWWKAVLTGGQIEYAVPEYSVSTKDLKAERDALEEKINAHLIETGEAKDANLWDITGRSLSRGFLNSKYGQESYKEMVGIANEKAQIAEKLEDDKYQFVPGNKFERAVGGAFELLGQQVKQWTDPRSLGAGAGAAGVAFAAGQAGPQIAVAEEILTVPGAFAIGMQAGSALANYEIEAGFAYNELIEAGISKETAQGIAVAVGTGNAALELIQMDELTKSYKILSKKGTSTVTKAIAKELANRGVSIAKETAQEVAQEGITIAGTQIGSKIETGEWAYDADEVTDRLVDTAESSALSFGLMNAPGAVTNSVSAVQWQKNTNKQTDTKLTETEQKVVDKVYQDAIAEQEKDGKLTNNEKRKIYDQVLNDFEKGYITTDTIEETLGGDTYKTYRETVDSEDALQSEFDELNKMKQGEMTGEQVDRRTELKQQLEELKTTSQREQLKAQLSDEVFGIAKDSRLAESYNEKARRGQSFEADISKYDAKQQKVIQNAIDSGILNNTNRTHEFVDMIAKISADKGVSFDFVNNEKLKESGFAVEGATVNGYVNENGITLNIDSAKATRSVAGHEITHVLEGTELYTELQNVIFEYAKTKGEYDSRMDALTKLYANVEGADINAELTADLVGDYLFDDADFINNLSTKHRNLFQKIYDEIKYLCKVATAGSKEARELERVRKVFADVYRADSQASGDTKYSLTEYTAEEKKAHNDMVREHFGKTYMWAETGYLLLDGTKLDMSGKHDGAPGGYRTVDHRDIVDALGDDYGDGSYSGSLVQFMSEGNIRIIPEIGGINLSVQPTEAQEKALADYVMKHRGEVVLDIDDANGYTVVSVEYPAGTRSSKVLGDIRAYFEDGTKPEMPVRYSLSDSDGNPIDTERISHSEFNNKYSLSHNAEIAKGQNDYLITHKSSVTAEELAEAQRVTAAMVDVMMKYSSILPEDKIGKVLTKNGSYDRSVENTTICVRTLAYNEFVDKVQEEIGRPLTQMESFLVSQKMYDIATDPQCLYCYVSLDRKAFNDMLLRYMQDRDTVIAKYNNSDKTNAAIESLYEEFLHGRKPTKEMRRRFDSWISYVDNGTQLLSLADIATEERQSTVANGKDSVLAEQLKDARKYAQSASWSKIQKDYVAYRDEILKLGDKVVKNLNEHYGMRWYSFSDYSAAFIVENMQQITDASIRGLKGLSYTKDTDYAEIFAPSGMNINISVFVNTDADGNFFIDEKQSANLEKALKLREQYPNVGIVATVTNDEALRWAGEQEWTDVIIPFHIVRTGTDVAEYYKWLNYTAESADTIGNKDMWDAYLDSLNLSENARKRVSKNIYPSEHKNDKNTYLNLCESRGLTPRFARFAGEDWYMKLVNETRLSAEDSSVLKPVYNEDAAKASFAKFVDKGGYEGGWYKDGTDVDAEAKAVAADVLAGKKANEVDYGRQDGFAPENLIAGRKANRQHGKHSLSAIGETHRYKGDVPMRDLALNDVAPVQDSVQESVQDVAPVAQKPMTTDDMIGALWDAEFKMRGYDPNAEQDSSEQAARDAFKRIGDKDAPPETEAPYYGESKPERAEDPFLNRDWDERKTKAFTTDNPDAKPFFQEEAQRLAADYAYTEKAERGFSQEQYYNSGGEAGFYGWSRMAADDINTLMDVYGLSYAQIEDGLDAIIHDTPKVNNKPAKTIEFILNKRMLTGYKAFYSGEYIPPNQGYIEWLNGQQNAAEYAESTAALTDADAPMDIAPTADTLTVEDVMPIAEAPVAQQYEAIKPKAEKEPRMARATPAEQARADILTEEPQKDKKKGGVWSKIKNNVLDKGMVFEDLSLATGNRELQARWNSIRYAEGKAQRLMGEGNASVKSLNSIRDAVDKTGKTQQFYEYLYHQHNVDRMTLAERYENVPNKTVFGDAVTADVSRTAVAELEKANPEFKQYAKDVYDYMTYLRGLLVEGGVISNETAKLWQEMYPHYVPIRRLGDEGLNINVPLDTGRTGVNAPIKRAKGGNRDILPLFDTMGQRTIQTFKAIAKNRFGVELKNTLGTTIESDALGVDDAIDSIDTQDGLLQEGKNGKKPTFTVFENGEKVTFEITDEMYDAMKPTSEGLAYTNKVLNTVGNIRRGTLTEYNPWFMLKNAVKDVQDVLINSQHATRTYAAIPKAIKQMATKGHWYQEYLDNGGEQNTYFDNETNTFAKENKALEIAKKVTGLDAISKANNIIERLPRLAEYIASREAGRSVDVSMLDAARVTTNFAAGGDLAKFANRNGATFLNASIQGAMQQARNIREAKANGLKGWAKLAGVYTLAGLPAVLLNHLIWDDDEEYEELSDYVKQNYYIVGKFGDGKFVRIPKGRTVAVIQNAFEQMDNAITGDDEVDLKAFVDLVVTNLAPNNPVDNNILSPIIQVANNETWYGEDLVPTRLQDLPAAEQYDESTDAISRWLGEKTNTSPYKWNYLLDQYSGVVGDTFLPMLTTEAESGDNTFGGNMVAPLKDMFSTDSVMKNQNVSDFYDKVDELTTNAKGSKATDEDVLKYKYMNSVNADLGELYGQKREIQNGDLPDDIKYNRVREIQRQIDEMAEEALVTYGGVSITGDYATVGDRYYHKNDEGEWVKVTDEQLEKQDEVTSGLGITPAEYWGDKDEYDMAYEYPEKYALLKENGLTAADYKELDEEAKSAYTWASKNPGKYTMSKAISDDLMTFYKYKSDLGDIYADKDENGESISGSAKEKKMAYIESLDLDYGQKLILHRSMYDSKKDKEAYNSAIVEYLDSREDISWEDMKTILEELDFTVYDDGRITW